MSLKKKRILVISDTHCGHQAGLTPPSWQNDYLKNSPLNISKKREKFFKIQNQIWNWYIKTIDSLGKIDILFHLGDCIDGKGEKSGGTELITSDRNEQCEIAIECIDKIKAKNIFMCYGTGYHVGNKEDFEDNIARELKAKISSHEWISIYNKIFDIKHSVGSSNLPYSRGTPISKDKLWNAVWFDKKMQPKSDILLRGHVHYDYFCGDSEWLGVVNPSMQWSSKFGTRICSGNVSIGMTVFDVYEDGSYNWQFKIANLECQKILPIKV